MIFNEPPEQFKPKFEVVSCYVESGGELLFLKRQSHKPQGGTWGVPAGKVDPGEDALAAVKRELWEETGIEAQGTDFVYHSKFHVRYPEYDFIYHVFQMFTKAKPAVVLRLQEHEAYEWCTPTKALNKALIPNEDMIIKAVYADKLV